jgi:hypothetical protein
VSEGAASPLPETMDAYASVAQQRPWMKFYGEAQAPLAPDSTTALDLFSAVPPRTLAALYFET